MMTQIEAALALGKATLLDSKRKTERKCMRQLVAAQRAQVRVTDLLRARLFLKAGLGPLQREMSEEDH